MTESSKEGLLEELLEIQRTHQRLFAAAMGYIELDLTMEQRNEIVDRMIEEEVGEIPDLLARVRSNSDLDPYWTGHVLCFFGYVLGRAGKDDQAAIHLQEAVDIFSDYEKSHPYPDGFPLEEIKKYGADNSYFSQHAHGLRVVMLPEDEKEQAHIENIERVKNNFPDNKYWIAETYRMAGENIAFREEAVDYFRQGLGYIESLSDIDDLKNNEKDDRFHTWLKLKVEYIEHLDMYKKTDAESEEVLKGREEIEPYKHLITWRQEVSWGDSDNESDDSDDAVDDEEKEVIQYSDGSSYTGVVTDGLANGWGTRWYADDRRVVGNFEYDKPHTAVEFDGDAEVIAVYVEFNRTEGTAESHIESGNWTAEEFHQAISEDRSLEGSDLQGLDLQGRKFVSRVMNQSNLSRARLDNAKFKHAYLIDANLTGASLVGSDFSNATGASAVMKDANLSGARFVDAKFSDADFSHVNLKGANLSWAMLDMANLTGADLTGADISHTNLLGATYDGTTMPDGSVKTEDPSNYEVLEKELENSNWMYEGEAQDDEPHGEGTIYIKDESRDGYLITYYGQFENGIKNGEGHLVLPNGLKLFGEFVEDKLPMGTLINDIEGFTYTGELQGYAPHGQGTSVIHDGTRFVGEFSEGQPKKGTVYDAEGNETEKLRPGIGGTLGRLFKKD